MPTGYLLCNGSKVSRTTYANLFAKIGTTYGKGNGSSTFNLPNLVGKFLEGASSAGTSKDAGIPNIIGEFRPSAHGTGYANLCNGVFYDVETGVSVAANGVEGTVAVIGIDASKTSSVYRNDVTTVQPPAITTLFCIKY